MPKHFPRCRRCESLSSFLNENGECVACDEFRRLDSDRFMADLAGRPGPEWEGWSENNVEFQRGVDKSIKFLGAALPFNGEGGRFNDGVREGNASFGAGYSGKIGNSRAAERAFNAGKDFSSGTVNVFDLIKKYLMETK
mgnify:CR=1 FL=1